MAFYESVHFTDCLFTATTQADMGEVQQKTCQVGDAEIFYRESGKEDGLCVLFLHGARFHSGTWHKLGTLDTLNLNRPVVVSPSMSGGFSLPLATKRSDLIGGFVPVAPVAIGSHREQLKNISVPTLIVWGTNDTVIPISQADILEGANHPCYLDELDLFHQGMSSFLHSLKDNSFQE